MAVHSKRLHRLSAGVHRHDHVLAGQLRELLQREGNELVVAAILNDGFSLRTGDPERAELTKHLVGSLEGAALTKEPGKLLAVRCDLGNTEEPGDLLVTVGALLELRHEGGVELQGDPWGTEGSIRQRPGATAPRSLLALLGELALEAVHAARRVDELLIARVERVADAADLDLQLFHGGAGLELVSATAANGAVDVVGMDAGLHDIGIRLGAPSWRRGGPPRG